jgi:hypothetical protein
MNELAWLVGHSCQSLTRREFDWVLVFDRNAHLVIACLWRLIEAGRIRVTSSDDGHQFGLPAPMDAAAEVYGRIALATVEAVGLREGTLDLELRFNSGHIVQIIPDSSGYEAWNLSNGSSQFIAVGGGKLATIHSNQAGE